MDVIPFAAILSFGAVKLGAALEKRLAWRTTALPAIVCVLLALGQVVSFASTVHPTIDPAGYRELEEMRRYLMPDSVVITQGGIGYWVQYVTEAEISRPNPSLWDSYSHVYALFPRRDVPPQFEGLKPVFAGRVFLLFELPRLPP